MNPRAMTIFGALLLMAATGYGAYRLGQRSVHDAPAASPATGRKILYWQDPMVPGQRFDKPGKSPYMDMDLVPVYADGQSEGGSVRVNPGVQQNLGIRLAEVREGSLGTALRLVGNIAYNERERVLVQARSNGFVERLYARAPLDRVRKGQPLFDLYAPDWVAAQEDYLAIRRMGPAQANGLLDAALQRMRLAGMTDAQIHQVAARGKVLNRVTVVAPESGVITELAAREGMTVGAGAALMTINGLRSVWVNAQVPENAVAAVRPGMQVQASTPAYPGESFDGKIEALLPQVDPATRTLTARVELANPGARLTPGMFANISLVSPKKRQVLLVPSEAVIRTGTRSVVIVAQAGGRFAPVEVTVGAESDRETELLSGVRAGEKVVASGQFLIDSEASLRGAVRRLDSGGMAGAGTPAAPAVHHGSGKVEKIAADEITISHGPIPSLNWGPMTMGFVPPAAGMPPGLKAGDSIDFDLRARADGRYEITALRAKPAAQSRGPGAGGKGRPGYGGHDHSGSPAPIIDGDGAHGHADHGAGEGQ